MRRRAMARKRAREQLRPKSPEAVEGRKHIDIQTELYLEELADRIEEADVQCQTDDFLDRPPSPLFVPAKSGEDKETQILDNELFNFDIEVKPILEVLVGKTIEQSLLEVCGEEELANLRAQQRAFEELRNAELVEQQRLEEQDRRHREEKARRVQQQREVQEKERETANKIAARAFAQSYLADLVPSVFGTLAEHGYFYDPVERDVESGFLPWLVDAVNTDIDSSVRARALLDGLLREVIRDRHTAYRALETRIEQQRMAEEDRRAMVDPSAAAASETQSQPRDEDENDAMANLEATGAPGDAPDADADDSAAAKEAEDAGDADAEGEADGEGEADADGGDGEDEN
ncbi:hypothetical protein BOX15_Mlig020095g3 [Macrostomum lignano]|nr:hypothetical protein BOX15_Mlig020095g3 [Macrostomum lignano]